MRERAVSRCAALIVVVLVAGMLAARPWQLLMGQEAGQDAGRQTGPALQRNLPNRNASTKEIQLRDAANFAANFTGAGSCASPACHGGPIASPSKWKSSYTVWAEQDRHSKAYAVLHERRSMEIVRRLDRLADTIEVKPFCDARCLACHATAQGVGDDARALAVDGVGCESCHGAAKAWKDEHTSKTFGLTADNFRCSHGDTPGDGRMVNIRDLKVRAQVCVDCHIGAQGPNGRATQNMNHDMVAAGHPRLVFEYSTFLANVPRHWEEAKTTSGTPPMKVWAIGQTVSTQAAVRLLAARANEALAAPDKTPWPELAEYDCYTCHHAITPGNSHLAQLRPTAQAGHRPGQYPWSRWYAGTARPLLADRHFSPTSARIEKLDQLSRLMAQARPAPIEVATQANAAAADLDALATAVMTSPFSPDVTAKLLSEVQKNPPTNWDEACGQYLFYRNAFGGEERLRPLFAELRKTLEFTSEPAGAKSAGGKME